MKRLILLLTTALLTACASYSGSGLLPGRDSLNEVVRVMGEPAMRWTDPDGSVQLAYPRGPFSPDSFMVRVGPDGKLRSIENTLTPESLARIQPGMTKEQVLRTLGPPEPSWTVYFPRRDELAWDWRVYENGKPAHFIVLFDNTKGIVRSAMQIMEPVVAVDR